MTPVERGLIQLGLCAVGLVAWWACRVICRAIEWLKLERYSR